FDERVGCAVASAIGCGEGPETFRVKLWSKVSRNAKNTSTAYPTRKARASGGMETACVMVKLLNSPTTAPPMPAMRKRARLVSEGTNVLVLICCSNERTR